MRVFVAIPDSWRIRDRYRKLKFKTLQDYLREIIRRDLEGATK